MGVLSIGINLLLFASLKWTTATNHALLVRLDLPFVVLIGCLLGLERVGPRQVMLILVMLAGMALVAEVDNLNFSGHLIGDVMVVGAAIGFAANAFVIRHILKSIDGEAVALYNIAISTLGFFALVFINDEWAVTYELKRLPSAWSWVILLGLIVAIWLPLYYAALRRMPVWKLRTWMLAVPVLVALADWLFWGTCLNGQQSLGAAMVMGGLVVLTFVERYNVPKDMHIQ